MELSILLIQQICQLFIMIFFGFLLVRGRVLTAENSKVLSILLLYVACPCAIINSFMIDFTSDKLIGLGISFLGAILVHIIFIPFANLLGKIFGFTPIEKATLIYSNSGNLIIPLVGAILGNEWVIYSSGYMVIQTILLWTHAKSLVCNEPSFDIKKILLNINIIAIIIGICLFMFQLQLPSLLVDTFSKVGSMMGPLAMIVIGMLIGEMDLRSIFVEKRTYLISLFRLVVFPLIMILIFKFTGRLALVLQILRWACDEVHRDFVDIDSTKSAIALSEYFENCYINIQKYMLRESVEPQKRELLDCLSATFTTADAIQAGKEVGLSERSVMYSLVSLATNKVIKKVKRGEYEKLQ